MLKQGGLFAPISREGALVLNNLLLTTACASVLFGTLYPLGARAIHRREDLGRRAVLQHDLRRAAAGADLPDAVRLLARLEARRPARRRAAARRRVRAAASPCCVGAAGGRSRRPGAGADRGGARGVRHARLAQRSRRARLRGGGVAVASLLARARGLPLSFWGGALAHFGVGVHAARPRRDRASARRRSPRCGSGAAARRSAPIR